MTGFDGASGASWTRTGRACRESLDSRDQLTQASALVRKRPLWGKSVPARIYNTPETFLSFFKGLSVHYLLQIGINLYLLAHVCTYRQILLAVWCIYVLLLEMPYLL